MNSVYSSLFNQQLSNRSSTILSSAVPNTVKQGFKYVSSSPTFRSSSVNLRGADEVIRHAYRVSDVMSELDLAVGKPTTPIYSLSDTNRTMLAYLDADHAISGCGQPTQLFSLVDLEVSFANSAKLSAAGSASKLRLDGGTLALTDGQTDLHNLISQSIKGNLSVGKQTR